MRNHEPMLSGAYSIVYRERRLLRSFIVSMPKAGGELLGCRSRKNGVPRDSKARDKLPKDSFREVPTRRSQIKKRRFSAIFASCYTHFERGAIPKRASILAHRPKIEACQNPQKGSRNLNIALRIFSFPEKKYFFGTHILTRDFLEKPRGVQCPFKAIEKKI